VPSGVVLEERSDYWVNLHDLFHPLKNLVWPREYVRFVNIDREELWFM
jgi:hypothetical protein